MNFANWLGWILTKFPSLLLHLTVLAGAYALLAAETYAQEIQQVAAADSTELSLEELININVDMVFAASKFEQKVTQAPASVSIVTSDEFQKYGYRSMADALRAMRGFYISNDRNYWYVGSQGFQRPGDFNTRYLFLIDGHRMNDNIFNAGSVGTDNPLDVDLVDRVEVIRGPSSSIYGSNAFLGVINIITKKGRQLDGAEASVEGGSFGTYQGRFSFGKKFDNDIEWLISGTSYRSDGQTSLYYQEFDQRVSGYPRARNDGFALNADGENSRRLISSISYHDFTLTGLYSFRTKDIPTAPYGSFFGGTPARARDERDFVELKYDHHVGETTELSGRFSYDVFPHLGSFLLDYGGNNQAADAVMDYDGENGKWLTTEIQLKQQFQSQHTVIVGAEYRENLSQQLVNYDATGTTFFDDRRSGRTVGIFGHVEAVLQRTLVLSAGLRYDYFDTFGGTVNPRVGLIYNPWEATTFKMLYGQAFRAPNDYELYYGAPSIGQLPNPALRPETIRTYEFIYEQYLPSHLRFSASVYEYRINNLISQTLLMSEGLPGLGLLMFDNVDRVQARGVEVEMEGKYPGGLLARASYALQWAEDANTESELTNSPRHLLKGNLSVPLLHEKLFAGLELQYQSSIKTLAGNRARDFLVTNVTLFGKELVHGVGLSVSASNVLDTKYGSAGSGGHAQEMIGQDGRSLRAKLTYRR